MFGLGRKNTLACCCCCIINWDALYILLQQTFYKLSSLFYINFILYESELSKDIDRDLVGLVTGRKRILGEIVVIFLLARIRFS